MITRRILLSGGLAALAVSAAELQAQDLSTCWLRGQTTPEQAAERPSPLRGVSITLAGEEALLCHSSPSARGREVMGSLVPFGEVWRTGANESTQLVLPLAVRIGGVDVEPGHYSLYSIPGEETWRFFLSSAYERWGIPIGEDVRAAEVASFEAPAAAIDEMVESLTFRWDSHGEAMGHLVLEWEHTRVEIPIHSGPANEGGAR